MRHVLSAVVQNQPGVLAHVSGMLASRGFNIDSLAVGETDDSGCDASWIGTRIVGRARNLSVSPPQRRCRCLQGRHGQCGAGPREEVEIRGGRHPCVGSNTLRGGAIRKCHILR